MCVIRRRCDVQFNCIVWYMYLIDSVIEHFGTMCYKTTSPCDHNFYKMIVHFVKIEEEMIL